MELKKQIDERKRLESDSKRIRDTENERIRQHYNSNTSAYDYSKILYILYI